ncbi:hypothetical protein PTTG_03263 [Puccinia triticina 1-1 BBBD Race 1]|uniref:methylated diphthine methylhydrolase n=1 Tax=Puccinia triticina (isolate 1-1 / race 1 (BBBD)) TaxID=630390 RepID=A0A180GI35_PUCT1|nr:hypothetical protein PTTG_03263 [Puccinia triticina 1-1 BBBD Race 1]
MARCAPTTIPTALTPCSLEFCPAHPRLAVCGFYQTHQPPPAAAEDDAPPVERIGSTLLFEAALDSSLAQISYRPLQSFDCPAVLDARWTQDPHQPLLISADAQAGLNVYTLLDPLGPAPRLDRLHTFACSPREEGVLCLSLDISDKRNKSASPSIVCSLSNGQVVLLAQPSQGPAALVETQRWNAHLYEPWTCAFDYWQPHSVFTGGDDCKLKLWDTRNTLDQPVLVNSKFDGGVTAIRSHHLREHMVAVGSYDARLRIFDQRKMTAAVQEEACGGGIWRIKWAETDASRVLLAAMHAGFRVLEIAELPRGAPGPSLPAPVVSQLTHRAGLAYGADWGPSFPAPSAGSPHRSVVAGCSFYDRALHLWVVD